MLKRITPVWSVKKLREPVVPLVTGSAITVYALPPGIVHPFLTASGDKVGALPSAVCSVYVMTYPALAPEALLLSMS